MLGNKRKGAWQENSNNEEQQRTIKTGLAQVVVCGRTLFDFGLYGSSWGVWGGGVECLGAGNLKN
jgi:hypothetical protein